MRGVGGSGKGGHAPQLEGLSGDIHRTLSAFASYTPAPLHSTMPSKSATTVVPGSHGSVGTSVAASTEGWPGQARWSASSARTESSRPPHGPPAVEEWANRRPALLQTRVLRASPGSPRLTDLVIKILSESARWSMLRRPLRDWCRWPTPARFFGQRSSCRAIPTGPSSAARVRLGLGPRLWQAKPVLYPSTPALA